MSRKMRLPATRFGFLEEKLRMFDFGGEKILLKIIFLF
jgi:hypothetical protein